MDEATKNICLDYLRKKSLENDLPFINNGFINFILDDLQNLSDVPLMQQYIDTINSNNKKQEIDYLTGQLKLLDPTLDVVKK